MPNIPQQQTIVQYVASSAQTQYTFAFYAPLATDIQVYYQASNATPIPAADLLILNTNYTVTFNADPTTGGYITLLFTPTTGYYLTINRQVQASLNTSFSNAQNFNGANLDAALDRLLLLCQQNQNYNLQRNLSYVINTYLPNAAPYTQLPPLAQNQFWAGSGSGIVAATIASSPSASVLQSMLASESPSADGASIVGYYDTVDSVGTTVAAFLNNLPTYLNAYFLANLASYFKPPQETILTSGSGTFSIPTGTLYLYIKAVAGGASGVSSGAPQVAGNAGTATTIAGLTLGGGSPGVANGSYQGGIGGAPSGSFFGHTWNGGNGESGDPDAANNGGAGGISIFGGAGLGGSKINGIGNAPVPNSGSGGAGGAGSSTQGSGAGGGAGAGIEGLIYGSALTALGGSISYSVGAGGVAPSAGTQGNAATAGASGLIIIRAYFQ